MNYNALVTDLESDFPEIVEIRRHMHMYPELSFQEINTRKFIADKLREFGYENVLENVGNGGVVASLQGHADGPVIAFRADFDALAITEETGLPYASKIEGVMHACGHDVHTATLLSVAKVLKKIEGDLPGKILFVFQHAEELQPGGALGIIESGVLDDVDAIYGIHVRGDFPYDEVIEHCAGYAMAAGDVFEITIQGKGGHGAAPHTSIDSAVVASFVINQLQTLISRKKDPVESGVLTIAVFKAGQMASNIIADTAFLKGTVRTFDPDVRDMIEEQISSMTQHICAAHGASAAVKYVRGYPAVYNHPKETALIAELFAEKIGADKVMPTSPRMGSEDFAYYLEKTPGSFYFVRAGMDPKTNYPHHHPKFAVDERCMLDGAKSILTIVEHYFDKGGEAS